MTAHAYRTALERRDGPALYEALHPDVVFDTPAFEDPIYGRDNVIALFGVLATVFEEPEFTDELSGEGSGAITFRLRVDGHSLEGVDYLQLDDDGLVRRITVTMRPLASLQILADRMAETVAGLSAARVHDPVLGYWLTFERDGEDLIIDTRVRPGGGPTPHIHPNGDERFTIETGRVEFLVGRRTTIAGPGDELLVPRGTRHSFTNVGDTDAVFRVELSPEPTGRGEAFFHETAAAARRGMYTRHGLPTGPRAAAYLLWILERYQDVALLTFPPAALQRRLLFPLVRRLTS